MRLERGVGGKRRRHRLEYATRRIRPGRHNARIDVVAYLIRRGLLPSTAQPAVAPLHGGYWNTVVRLRDDERDWVVKVYVAGDPAALFPILPADEARALDVLAGRQVAPESVAFCADEGDDPAVLVYRYLEGEQWQQGVEQVAALFRRQHAVAGTGFRTVPTDAAGILAEGDRLLDDADAEDADRLRAVRPTRPVAPAARLALIHTDAGAGNVIVGADGARLIDWQCPACGDPAEDLFAFLSPAFQVLYGNEPIGGDDERRFLEAYADDEVIERYAALAPALTYRMAAYCAQRRRRLGDADPAATARYARALDLSCTRLAEDAR